MVNQSNRDEIPEPKIIPDGRYQCTVDNKIYNNRDDYEAHCRKVHQVNLEKQVEPKRP